MNRQVFFDDRALEELRAARRWYAARNPMVALDFLADFERAVGRIVENSRAFPVRFADCRQVLLRRFPFFVVYRERADVIELLAVAHTSREPFYWRDRA